ncbi:MAG: hypothetical protein ABEH77_01215 [Halobacteriaceae archaeon]
MPSAERIHDALAVAVGTAFLVALGAALSAGPSPVLGSLYGVGVALLVLAGTLAVGYALMRRDR